MWEPGQRMGALLGEGPVRRASQRSLKGQGGTKQQGKGEEGGKDFPCREDGGGMRRHGEHTQGGDSVGGMGELKLAGAAQANLQVCIWGPGEPTECVHQGIQLFLPPPSSLSPWHAVGYALASANSLSSPVPVGPQSLLPSLLTRRPCAAHWPHLHIPWRKAQRAVPPGMPCLGPGSPCLHPAMRASSLLQMPSLEV